MTEKVTSKKHNFRQVYQLLKPTLYPHRFEFGSGIALILVSTVLEVLSPILLGKGVDVAISPEKQRSTLVLLAFGYLLLIVVKAVFESWQALVIQRTGQRVVHELRTLIFERIHALSIGYFDQNPTGRLLTRVVNDIKALSELFTASISVLVLDVLIILGTIGAMFFMHWELAGLVLVTFPLVFWTVWYFGEKLSIVYKRVRAKLSEINAFLGENIGAIGTIQRLGAEEERFRKFETIVDAHNAAQMESLRVFAMVQPIANTLNGFAMASLMGVGGYWVIQGKISIGVMVTFFAYLRNLFQPIRDLVEKYNTFLSAMVAADRIVAILEEPVETSTSALVGDVSNFQNSLSFEGVNFRYPTRQKPALENVSFTLHPNTSLAIVGPTGSGKSTLIRLLLRFYEPTSGIIKLGGQSLVDWDRKELRRRIGVIHQDVYLFRGTVRENLTLGKTAISDAQLEDTCRKTHFWEIISERGGLGMMIYEGGSNLSLGERQLLAFARILVFDPPVLVLDEATASVDRVAEKRLMAAMERGMAGRTSIVIAHRLSTIKACNQLMVLEHGKILESGTYSELLKARGMFYRFHQIHNNQPALG